MSPRNDFQCIHCGKVFRHRQRQYRQYLNCSRKPNLEEFINVMIVKKIMTA